MNVKNLVILIVVLFILSGKLLANEGNLPPVAVLTEDPNRLWFYNGEQVVFSSILSSDPDGYVNYSKFYVNGVLKKSSSYTTSYATCFVLYGSGITGCQELSNGATTVQVKLEVRDNAGEWSSETITYTIQERKGRRYFITDHLGSVRATVDDKGEVVGYDDFYPFGKVMPGRSSNSSNPNDLYKFTGHERDEEAGLELDYMNARNYDPITGRFLQIDPLSDQFPAWNPYHYVYNNPLGFTDPTGMAPTEEERGSYGGKTEMAGGDDCPPCKRIAKWYSSKTQSQRQEDFGGKQKQAAIQNHEGIQEGAIATRDAINEAGHATVDAVASTADVVSDVSTDIAIGGIVAAPFSGGSSLIVTGYALTVGTAADATSLAAKTVDAVVYDGSGEAAFDQFVQTSINVGAGAIVGRVAGSVVRTNVAGRFFNPSNGQFVTNRLGNTVSAASDATRVSVSLGTSWLLDND